MREIQYEILASKGVLGTFENGWRKEANIVVWNGGEPKFDIRDWSEDHNRMSRGITLTGEEAGKLIAILGDQLPAKEDFPYEMPDDCIQIPDPRLDVLIAKKLGTLSVNDDGWSREVTICSWNGGKPKVDIRSWAPGYRQMSRGIQLTREQAEALAGLDPVMDASSHEEVLSDAVDSVIDRIINYFIEVPSAELVRNSCDEVKVDSANGTETLQLRLDGRLVEISVREVQHV